MVNEWNASAMTPTDPAEVIGGLELFSDLEPVDLEQLVADFERLRVASHTRLYSSGDVVDYFFVIVAGEVSIFRDELGRPLHLQARLGPGEYFGEMGLFGGDQRSSARSAVTTELLRIRKDQFLSFLDERPALAVRIQVAAARRHSENAAAALDLGQRKDVRIRLGRRVLVDTPFRQHTSQLENLSFGGLCLRQVPASWQLGSEVSFTLTYQECSLAVEARVSWREEEAAGLAFTKKAPEHEEAVQRLLRRLLG